MLSDAQHIKALELLTKFELVTDNQLELVNLFEQFSNWDSFIAKVEENGLAPLVNTHLSNSNELASSIPKTVSLQIKALVIRHQRATAVRAKAITEILQAFETNGVECIALKGLALAYCLYPKPALRPMRDIDLLVPEQQALKAQQTLRELGYDAEDRKDGAMYDHHHLPIASKPIDGMTMSIEVHRNALSGDVGSSIAFNDLSEPAIAFEIEGNPAHRLGHIDTLRHLCHHSFEPARRIKLGSLLDITQYAQTYYNDINWAQIGRRYPFVKNTLRCLHFVTSLSDDLAQLLDAPKCASPARVGEGYLPLSHLLAQGYGKPKTLRVMLSPPDWWAHVFYNVAPECSLFWVKWWHHPIQVARWLGRRYWAIMRTKKMS